MERTEQTQDQSLTAQQILSGMPCWEQILLLANDLGADKITILRSSTI